MIINIQYFFLVTSSSAARNGDLEKHRNYHAFLEVTKVENKRKFERLELRDMPRFATITELQL